MARYLKMPGVSADSDAAALELWAVEEGAFVRAGDTVATVETEKAVVDIPVDEDSVVHRFVAEAGSMVPVGDPIAVLLAPGEAPAEGDALVAQLGDAAAAAPEVGPAPVDPVPAQAAPSTNAPVPPAVVAPTAPAPAAATAAGPGEVGRIFASPLARRIAGELGVVLAGLAGSGPHGRIMRSDVEAAAAAAAIVAPSSDVAMPSSAPTSAAADGVTRIEHTRLRRLVASRLQESKREAPHFYLSRHLRFDALLALRASVNEGPGVRISVNDLCVKAAARALVDVPEMNVIWTDDAVVGFPTADVSVAVASERGLVTPTFRAVENMSLSRLSEAIKDAVQRANAGRLQQSELEGGTLSISNLGMFGVDEFAAIINPPQAAILAIGAATRRPIVEENGELVAATVVTVTLSVDHRPVDGAVAARWLERFSQLIESPLQILV